MARIAVILFNLGGPDNQKAVSGFLYNLFSDKAIIKAPQPIRFLLAKFITWRRQKKAKKIYSYLGGGSPILANTQEQAEALENKLRQNFLKDTVKVFISMRYWHPFSQQVASQVKDFDPNQIIALPLYPQFSTTTTASSLDNWQKTWKKQGHLASVTSVCCYPTLSGFTEVMAKSLQKEMVQLQRDFPGTPYRVLFSAHGLPQKIVEQGDPYDVHIATSAAAVAEKAGLRPDQWQITYQSRVGPVLWLKPYSENVIRELSNQHQGLIIVPISFVSEHSETLVELDITYRDLALEAGAAFYRRLPTVGIDEIFIQGLANLTEQAMRSKSSITSCSLEGYCPSSKSGCYQRTQLKGQP
ncbi:MAG: ferrochelatase [Rhodospirillaceae bacterium]|nr:ferrochelatase [Rhodospirillaceae bacterium]